MPYGARGIDFYMPNIGFKWKENLTNEIILDVC